MVVSHLYHPILRARSVPPISRVPIAPTAANGEMPPVDGSVADALALPLPLVLAEVVLPPAIAAELVLALLLLALAEAVLPPAIAELVLPEALLPLTTTLPFM